jgi:hypothetical protein
VSHSNTLAVARGLLSPRNVLRSFWLICALCVMAPAIATAQSAPQPALVATTQASATSAARKVSQLMGQRTQLTARYQQQLSAIDRLKKQKASWRRDRELNSAQADANDTAKRLTMLDRQLAAARTTLLSARRSAVSAIDAELATQPSAARAAQLAKLRARLAPAAPPPKRIVIPDAEIDPLADPQELEQQAAALAAVERQLEAQRKGLDAQHSELQLVAELRQAHDRAGELSLREDDQPQRGAPRGTGRTSAEAAPTAGGASNDSAGSPGSGTGSGGGGSTQDPSGDTLGGESFGGDKGTGGSFESSVAVTLGEVIDRSTLDGLVRASRSGDPKKRAEAARLARDAVGKRLEQLRKKRAMIEARARVLRGGR